MDVSPDYSNKRKGNQSGEVIAYPTDHIRSPVIDLGFPSGKRRQDFLVEERPRLEVGRGSNLHAFPVAIGAKGIPFPVVMLDEAGVWEVGIQS